MGPGEADLGEGTKGFPYPLSRKRGSFRFTDTYDEGRGVQDDRGNSQGLIQGRERSPSRGVKTCRGDSMAVDDLIDFLPSPPPAPEDDLASVPTDTRRLSVVGRAKNLERLSDLPMLEALWIEGVNESQLQQILRRIDPLFLYISGMRLAHLGSLGELKGLLGLEIHRNSRVEDLAFLEGLSNLRLLALVGCNEVRALDPLSSLTKLEILDLAGGMWGTFSPSTLGPIRHLRTLRGISLKSIRVGDQSLEPLTFLTRLEHLELSNQFPTEEFARLSVAFPHLECSALRPFVEVPWPGRKQRVMVTGKGKPILELPKDQDRLDRYTRRFRELQEGFRAG